jgi:hypothetical protein
MYTPTLPKAQYALQMVEKKDEIKILKGEQNAYRERLRKRMEAQNLFKATASKDSARNKELDTALEIEDEHYGYRQKDKELDRLQHHYDELEIAYKEEGLKAEIYVADAMKQFHHDLVAEMGPGLQVMKELIQAFGRYTDTLTAALNANNRR